MRNLITTLVLIGLISCKPKDNIIATTPSNEDVKFASKTNNPDSAYTKEDIQFLKEIGLSASHTVRSNSELLLSEIAEKYKTKFGVRFVTDELIGILMQEKDLIIGSLADFNGTMPKHNINEFRNNLSRIREVDSSFNEYYYIRTELECGAKFLQRISEEEIYSGKGFIEESPNLNHGQAPGATLSVDREKYYRLKYSVRDGCDITIGRYTPYMQIVAPKKLFNTEGKILIGRQLVNARDPAILLRVQEGWLVLTTWD